MLGYSPTKTQELLGNPDKSANPTASSPACAGLAGEHCTISGKGIAPSYFSNLHNLGKESGKKIEHNMKSIDICSA